jgi:hypothetical protein
MKNNTAYSSRVENFPYKHTCSRLFIENNLDPNERYRDWLEKNIGKQGVNWEWDILVNDIDMVIIAFIDESHALLFELSCQ